MSLFVFVCVCVCFLVSREGYICFILVFGFFGSFLSAGVAQRVTCLLQL